MARSRSRTSRSAVIRDVLSPRHTDTSTLPGLDESAGFTPTRLTDVATLEQGVAAQARTSVTPPARCDFQAFHVSGKSVLVARIEGLPLDQRLARHRGRAYLTPVRR